MERESIPAGVGFALAFVNRGEMSEKKPPEIEGERLGDRIPTIEGGYFFSRRQYYISLRNIAL